LLIYEYRKIETIFEKQNNQIIHYSLLPCCIDLQVALVLFIIKFMAILQAISALLYMINYYKKGTL